MLSDRIQLDGKTYIALATALEMSGMSEASLRSAAASGQLWLRAAGKKVYVELESLRRLMDSQAPVVVQTALEPTPVSADIPSYVAPRPVFTPAREGRISAPPARPVLPNVPASASRKSLALVGVLSAVVLGVSAAALSNMPALGKVFAQIGGQLREFATSQSAAVGATEFRDENTASAPATTSPVYSVPSPQRLVAETESSTSQQPIYYVYNYPVIERIVERERLISGSSVSEELLNKRIQDLNADISARLSSLSSANATQITNVYTTAAVMGRIEHLDELDLTNPTITKGNISASSLSVTGNGTSTFSTGLNLSSGCLSVRGVCIGGSSVTGNSGQVAYFSGTDTAIGTSTISISAAGNVGVGTTSPFRKFSLVDTVSTAQAAIAYDATRYSELRVDTSGDLNIGASGNDTFFNNDNLWVCTGGSFTVNGCPSGTPTGQGNLIVENKIGIGTSTPAYKLSIETQDSTTDFLQIASSTAQSIFIVKKDGKVGIGTSTPTTLLSIGGLLTVGASSTGQLATMGTATSTFNGDIKITGKLDVGTIDPVYTIDGVKYATYGSAQVGIKEEVSFRATVSKWDEKKKMYLYTIDFNTLEKGSDLWLFYQVTDFGKYWENLIVTLTPSFDGRVFYEEAPQKGILNIYASERGSVSVRLVANRFDFTKWKNLRPDQEDSFTHFELQSK